MTASEQLHTLHPIVPNPNEATALPALGDANPSVPERLSANSESPPVDPDNPPWGVGAALLVWFASIVLMFLIPLIFIIPYAATKGLRTFDPFERTAVLLQVISLFPTHLLTFAIVWIVVTGLGKRSFWPAIGWGWARGFRLWSCVGLGTLMFVVGSLLAKLLGAEKPTQLEQIINSSLTARYLISFLAVCTAPFVEEFVYRGVLYSALRRDAGIIASWILALIFGVKLDSDSQNRLGVCAAVVLVLALFTVIHVPQYWPNTGVIAAVALLSIVLTLVRAYSGRLLPCVAIHLVFNGIQAVILIAEPQMRRFVPPVEPTVPVSILLPLIRSIL